MGNPWSSSAKKHSLQHLLASKRYNRGFTLVELLVVIVIVATLAGIVFVVAGKARERANSVDTINRVRQSGLFLFTSAADNGGKITVFVGGNGHTDKRLISQVASSLGFDPSRSSNNAQIYEAVKNIVYTKATDPGSFTAWETFGINIDDNDRLGVDWNNTRIEDENGITGNVNIINPGTATRAESYPLIADSSNDQGIPRLRFGNGNPHKFAMRFNGKGAAYFLDGSARLIDPDEMGKYGITAGYLFEDGPNSKPKLVRATEP